MPGQRYRPREMSKRGTMAAKRTKNKVRRISSRSQNERQGQFGTKSYGLLLGVIALAVIVVAAFAILGPKNNSTPTPAQPSEITLINPDDISLDKSLGPADASIVVVEYADFQCPYCKQFAEGTEHQIKENYVDTGKIRFVFRHLAFIGAESLAAAQAAECANEQDRFWDYHDKLFAEQSGENSGAFSEENLKRFAGELELNTQQFNECLDSNKYQSKVQQEIAQAQRLGIRSTPSVFVNGQLIEKGSNYQALQTAIESALP